MARNGIGNGTDCHGIWNGKCPDDCKTAVEVYGVASEMERKMLGHLQAAVKVQGAASEMKRKVTGIGTESGGTTAKLQ